jgi:hypothetical protein
MAKTIPVVIAPMFCCAACGLALWLEGRYAQGMVSRVALCQNGTEEGWHCKLYGVRLAVPVQTIECERL